MWISGDKHDGNLRPKGMTNNTNFVFVKTSAAREIHQKLLEKSIAVRCFGKYLRITAPAPEQMEELLAALHDILVEMRDNA